MVAMKQRHAVGTTNFILPDDQLYILATGDRPLKRVTEGEVFMHMGDPMNNADLSQEFLMMKRTGIAVVMAREFGSYKITG